jgi:hypothetical protein
VYTFDIFTFLVNRGMIYLTIEKGYEHE